ncbi:MAG: HAMP domain-containing sensor histidine kinase [Synechococcales bacterium]|nr:HAMP domain-containing sensor histidine kinase [Synechococcales bacterium]
MLSQLSLPGRISSSIADPRQRVTTSQPSNARFRTGSPAQPPPADRTDPGGAAPGSIEFPMGITQSLEALVRHGALAGACTVWFDRIRQQPQIVFALSPQENLCPMPPLNAIAHSLSQSKTPLVAQPLAWDLLPNYHSVVCGFEQGSSGMDYDPVDRPVDRPVDCPSDQLAYLLGWGRDPLQPWQVYMIEQQAKLFQQSLQQINQTEQYHCTLGQLEESVAQTLRSTEHQLRTPLALIQMYVDLVAAQELPNNLQEPIDRIQTTLNKVEDSLRHLCQGKLQAQPQRRSMDLRELLLERLEVLQPWLEEKQINLALELQSCWIAIDPWQMQQVFQNLLENALFFSPVGSTLTCRCCTFQQEVLIQIGDQGQGLSLSDQQHLFEPYYTQRQGGTGLGLTIAWQVVQDHCGRIWAENLPQGGAQFSVILPR